MIRASVRSTRGYTLLELTISTVLLATVGLSVSIGVKLGNDSHATVTSISSESRATRKSVSTLVEDIRGSADARITVTTDPDGNSLVQLSQPIEVAGALVWGVRDRRLGVDEDTWNRQDWTIRYLVDAQNRLVRRVVDIVGVTQAEDVLSTGLRDGNVAEPGFRVVHSGDIWQVNIATRHGAHGEGKTENELHVRTRN